MKYAFLLIAATSATSALAQSSATTVASTPTGSTTTVTSGAPAGAAPATTTVTTTPKGTTVQTTAVDPKTKLVCQYTDTLGTRLGGHKVCKTREQWRQEAAETRSAVDRAQLTRGTVGN